MDLTDQLFGKGRMVAFLQEHANMCPRKLDDAMREEVATWTNGAEQSDDITMLTLEYKHASRSE
ncbi:MAG: SpoIIE family protein phosphatase [Atopobiaceae bacterium]|nr:SpoIIE family protein phosphatase [Atopobiaceae bacterium]